MSIDRYKTENSLWLIDTINNKYYRMPLDEGGRKQWEDDYLTPNLVDGVWLDLEDMDNPVQIHQDPVQKVEYLVIRYKGSVFGIYTSVIVDKKVTSYGQTSV